MWRHNTNGKFNVGYGGQARRWVIDECTLNDLSRSLRRATIRCCDFEEVIENCDEGDFVFLDPPYRPGEKALVNGHYVGRQFTYDDHRRLASVLAGAKKRKVKWLLTISSHPDIVKLYRGCESLALPRGTGRMPGAITKKSGEIVLSSCPINGVPKP